LVELLAAPSIPIAPIIDIHQIRRETMKSYSLLLIFVSSLVGGCGMPEATFTAEFERTFCEYAVECVESFETVDTCLEERNSDPQETVCPNYDGRAAADCIAAVEESVSDCDRQVFEQLPDVCNEVCAL
jgi:hypothetical protein